MDDQQFPLLLQALQRLTAATERQAAAITALLDHIVSSQPVKYGLGVLSSDTEEGRDLDSSSSVIRVGAAGGGVLYLVVDGREVEYPGDIVDFSLQGCSLLYKPGSDRFTEAFKIFLRGKTDKGFITLEFSATSGTASTVIPALLSLEDPRQRIRLKLRRGDREAKSVLANVYDADGQLLRGGKLPDKWKQCWPSFVLEFYRRMNPSTRLDPAMTPNDFLDWLRSGAASGKAQAASQTAHEPEEDADWEEYDDPGHPDVNPLLSSSGDSRLMDEIRAAISSARDLDQLLQAGKMIHQHWEDIREPHNLSCLNTLICQLPWLKGGDISPLIIAIDTELVRLRWDKSKGRAFLIKHHGKRSRSELTPIELLAFQAALAAEK